jgi:outer membrane protein TolC
MIGTVVRQKYQEVIMKRIIPLAVAFLCVFAAQGRGEEIVQKGEQLTLERCVAIALMKNPTLVAAKGTMNATESRVGQAKANYYPQLNWTSGYSRISPASGGSQGNSLSTGSSGGSSAFDQYTSGATLSQNIYDFGRTSNAVKISNLNFDASRSDLENVTEQVVFSVKQSYYAVVQAKYNRLVAEDTVKQTQQHLEQAKGFFEVGTKPKFDVIKAEVDVSNAKLNLIKLGNNYQIAVVNLNNAMGIPSAPEYTLHENLVFDRYEITFDEALAKAYENRPDVKSAVAKRQAAETSIDSAKSNFYPFLTGNAGYNWSGGRIDQMEHSWNVGAILSFPIFSGFLTKYQVSEAKANLDVQKANEESLKQTVFLEVQQAYLTLRAAEEAIPTAKLGVEQAQENLDIANGRYAAGVGNPIEVTDAEVSLATARLNYIQALYADKVAQAALEKAMGKR